MTRSRLTWSVLLGLTVVVLSCGPGNRPDDDDTGDDDTGDDDSGDDDSGDDDSGDDDSGDED